LVVATALVAAGCSSSKKSGGTSASGGAATTPGSKTPKTGGTLTIGTFSETPSLDPVTNIGTGVTGGMELAALYDNLMTYNTATGKYVPKVAESLTSNADQTVWTLKLRPGIRFTDGTAYDAAAVVFNLKRQIAMKGRSYALVSFMKSFDTPDPLTVVITTSSPNNTVPFSLASAPGMIASPTAINKLGTGLGTNATGAGAGPFMFSSFSPGEAVVLTRNPNYWGGQVYLDDLRFVNFSTQDLTYESFKSGTLQAALLRDPTVIARSKSDGYSGLQAIQSAGNTIEMNDGVKVACQGRQPANVCAGQPDGTMVPTKAATTDPRIRRAVAAAINLDTLNQRVYQGNAQLNTALIAPASRWYDGVAGPKYDPALAKQLVSQVKAEGSWDGTIRVSCTTAMPSWGLVVQALLEAVGFKVNLDANKSVAQNTATVVTQKDFDLACFGTSILEEEPFSALIRDTSYTGWSNPTAISALKSGLAASSDAQKKAELDVVAKAYTADVPMLSLGGVVQEVVVAKNLVGATQTVSSIALFDKAWLS
jgi:peptide/nickel transport system substrate-binding protein